MINVTDEAAGAIYPKGPGRVRPSPVGPSGACDASGAHDASGGPDAWAPPRAVRVTVRLNRGASP